jgi:hypothetical protein
VQNTNHIVMTVKSDKGRKADTSHIFLDKPNQAATFHRATLQHCDQRRGVVARVSDY